MNPSASEIAATDPLACDPVFDRRWWFYSLCRERLFADHTQTIAAALQPLLAPQQPVKLLEVGCGPGFYSRRLAARFPFVQATGVDTSERLLTRARLLAQRARLHNCCFLRADAANLRATLEPTDAVIVSRLFLIVSKRDLVLHSIFDVLRPGGIFFVAEPTSELRTSVPISLMRALDAVTGSPPYTGDPIQCSVLSHTAFQTLIGSQPWSKAQIWRDKRYQYALCHKAQAELK